MTSLTVLVTHVSPGAAARLHPGPDVDGDAGDAAGTEFDLAAVDTDPQLHADVGHRAVQALSAPRCLAGRGERRKEAVAGGVDLGTASSRELGPDQPIVGVEYVAPPVVAQPHGSGRRTDDVGEHHGEQLALAWRGMTLAGDEVLDLGDDSVAVGQPDQDVDAIHLDESRSVDVRPKQREARQRPAGVRTIDDQRRDVDARYQGGDIGRHLQRQELLSHRGTRAAPSCAVPPLPERDIVGAGRRKQPEEVE